MTATWEKTQGPTVRVVRKGFSTGDVDAKIEFAILENGKTKTYQIDLNAEDRKMIERLVKD